MGLPGKPHAGGLYGSLLKLYPQSFQRYYGTTMQQTFTDMLDAEPTHIGKARVWGRTLANLPLSAAQEYLTNGKELSMNRTTKLILAGACVVVVIVGIGSFWKGSLQARNNVGIVRVTTAQLANAMQQDDFYSTYGDTVVMFSGRVTSIQKQGNVSLVTFTTGRPYSVVCQFSEATAIKAGQTIPVAAPAGSADRETHGVLLHNCLVNN